MVNKKRLGFMTMRAQPLHAGHESIILQASKQVDRLLLLIGSANQPRTVKNPWSYLERKAALEQFLSETKIKNVDIYPVNDYRYMDGQWINDVTKLVESYDGYSSTTFFGHTKPGNDYLTWFPQYNYVELESHVDITATEIRKEWYQKEPQRYHPDVLADFEYFNNEQVLFSVYPFKESLNFNCADALLECAGHVLLIQRKFAPGRGTWALPGGFKNAGETFVNCAIRELFEETNVRVSEKVVRGSIVNTHLFDDPFRCHGIPRNTLCVHIKISLDADGNLPRANGADDATTCEWVPIKKIMDEYRLFDSHDAIISSMCGVVPTPAHLNPSIVGQMSSKGV